MPLATISDIHIHQSGDPGDRVLRSFSENSLVKSSTHVGLLGDIFDLMAGDHPEYLARHSEVFDLIRKWCEAGKVVFFAEGNHDMHLSTLFRRLSQSWSPAAASRLVVLRKDRLVEIDGIKIKLGHGDRYNQEDTVYLRYMDIITSSACAFLADHLMPYQVLKYLGERASVKSRKYGTKKFDEESVRQKFRRGVELLTPSEASVVIGGHSHVADMHAWDGHLYVNNGYPPKSGKFVYVDTAGARLVAI